MHYYPWLKLLHMVFVVTSLALFVLRSGWLWRQSPQRFSAWACWVPHVNDTLLLAAGLGLAILSRRYPFVDPWLTAKVVGLVVHVLLGLVALRGGIDARLRGAAWVGSLAAFGYVVTVAVTRDPTPWS